MSVIPELAKNPLLRVLDRALQAGPNAALRLIESHVRHHPDASPAEIQRVVDRWYRGAAAASGAAAGAAAAVPGAGIPAAVVDTAAFIGSSVTYVFTTAALAGDPLNDPDRLRMLALAALVGDGAVTIVFKSAGRTGAHLGGAAARAVPLEAIRAVNRVLGRHFVTRYGTRQGILVLGKALPAGVGSVIGSGGNLALAQMTVSATRRLVGNPVSSWEKVWDARGAEGGEFVPAA